MIVWVNGASGSGKTQIAYELRRRVANGWVADPEHVGFALQRMTPAGGRSEFQHLHAWRCAVADQLHHLDRAMHSTIIVPQLLLKTAHRVEIVDGLRDCGHEVHHVTLTAAREVLARRLRLRGQGSRSWAFRQIDRSVEILRGAGFAEHVATDDRSVDEVVEAVAACAGLDLVLGRESAARARGRRLLVQLRHVRVPR